MKAVVLGQSMKAQKGNYTPSLTSALERAGWSAPLVGHFTAGKKIIVLEAGCASGQVWVGGGLGKILPPPGFDLRIVQPVRCRLTEYAVPNHNEGYTGIRSDSSSKIKL